MRQGRCGTIPHQPAMIEEFLEFSCGGAALARAQVSLATHVRRNQAPTVDKKHGLAQLVSGRCLEKLDGLARIAVLEFNLSADGRQPMALDHSISREALGEVIGQRSGARRISGNGQC